MHRMQYHLPMIEVKENCEKCGKPYHLFATSEIKHPELCSKCADMVLNPKAYGKKKTDEGDIVSMFLFE